MGITYDQFIRTTSPKHILGAQKLFADLYANGFIELKSYTGSYCVSDEAFVDAPVGTPCPDCFRLLEEVTEENFFFKLSAFQRPLIDLIESNQLLISPDPSRNEVLSFIRGNPVGTVLDYLPGVELMSPKESIDRATKALSVETDDPTVEGLLASGKLGQINGKWYVPGALKDLSISRSSFTWGIPVPEPAASTTTQKHVIYVWLDALANYMTALGYGSPDDALWHKFWPADIHLVGKEITRFHCVYWPAFLLALNPEAATEPGAPGLDSETWVSREAERPQLSLRAAQGLGQEVAAQTSHRQRLAPLRQLEDVQIQGQRSPHRNHPRRLRHPLPTTTSFF